MSIEAGHINITEFNKECIPKLNIMMEDLFCQYGVSIPYFLLDYDFPDYSQRPDWCSGYNFNLDWGKWGYWLPWFNNLLGLLFDEAHFPRWQLPDFSFPSWDIFNSWIPQLYENIQQHYVYDQSGTFIKDEVIKGETSGITGYYKWKDSDGYLHIAKKRDASGESVRDFEDEKITGQTSGAYAYTAEGIAWDTIYRKAGENRIWRYGWLDLNSYAALIDDYENHPTIFNLNSFYTTFWEYSVAAGTHSIDAVQTYCFYNTGDYSSIEAAKIRFTDTSVTLTGVSENPVLYVYKHDSLNVEWKDKTGAEIILQRTFTPDDNGKTIDLDIAPEHLTPGGYSCLRFILKRVENRDYWPDPEPRTYYHSIGAGHISLLVRGTK